jgi:hypothetical protein
MHGTYRSAVDKRRHRNAVSPRDVGVAEGVTLTDVTPTPASSMPADPWRRRLILLVAVLVVVFASATFIILRAYDQATASNVNSPAVATEGYLDALFNKRDDAAAARYACADQSGLAALRAYRDLVVDRVTAQGGTVTFSWTLNAHPGGDRSDVVGDLGAATQMQGTLISSHTSWTFVTDRRGDQWRVCSAAQHLPSPTPSAGP